MMTTNYEEPEIIETTDDAVRAVTKANDPYRSKNRKCFMIILSFLFLIAITLVSIYTYFAFHHFLGTHKVPAIRNNLESYVFSNTSLSISDDNDTFIEGEFIVNGTQYEFVSDYHSLSFIQRPSIHSISSDDDTSITGFTVYDHNDSDPVFVLEYLHQNGSVYTTEVTPGESANITVVDLLMRSLLVEHFVELSAKLGGAGYIGSRGPHIQDLHRFAQWMYRYEIRMMHHDDDDWMSYEVWDNMTEEFEKVNAIVSASANAGHWVQSMDELVSYTSNEYTPSSSKTKGRRLLQDEEGDLPGSCGEPFSECGNDCFGRCGADCLCWSWICGGCGCFEGCRQHDVYCSCESVLDYCCIDVFWIECDGSGDDEICS